MDEILKATQGKLLQGERDVLFQGISTDSRTVREGDLFIALKGVHFDGHQHALEALGKKAGGVLIEEAKAGDFRWNGYRPKAVVAVKDTLQSLGDLARSRRRGYGTSVVGVTGSNGKTTTKEMIAACLQTSLPVLKSKGNFNNLIGLPLTLLGLTGEEKVAVLELGMNVTGEIRRLTEISEPDVGLITNIQRVHLEGTGSLENVAEEKGTLFRGMRQDGTIVVNKDDPRVVALAHSFPGRKVTFGVKGQADVMAKGVRLKGEGTSFLLIAGGKEMEVFLPLLGKQFVSNALSAVAVAALFGIDANKAKEALEHYRAFPMRMEVCHLEGGRTLIDDSYNANPVSMELALETLAEIKGRGRAIALLGDMLELGEFSEEAHRRLGQKIKECAIDLVILLGEKAPIVVASAVRHGLEAERVRVVKSHSEALALLHQLSREGDWILVKGSRGMTMEKIAGVMKEGRA